MPNDVPPRIPDYYREATVRRLQEAFAQGHISHTEMDDHLQAVLTAKTHGDLVPVLASLPDINTGRTLTLAGKSGRFRRRGAWPVPRVIKVESEYGRVDFDLSQARIENPVVDIELQLRFGSATITLPDDAVVDIDDLRTVWKQPVYKTPQRLHAGGPRIRISGTMEFGRLTIRHKAH
ncbi:MAG: DUF1707 SHOCT-like domain-containing protein [Jiangellaceae bacterium]